MSHQHDHNHDKNKKPQTQDLPPTADPLTTDPPTCPTGYIWDAEQQRCILDIPGRG